MSYTLTFISEDLYESLKYLLVYVFLFFKPVYLHINICIFLKYLLPILSLQAPIVGTCSPWRTFCLFEGSFSVQCLWAKNYTEAGHSAARALFNGQGVEKQSQTHRSTSCLEKSGEQHNEKEAYALIFRERAHLFPELGTTPLLPLYGPSWTLHCTGGYVD